MIILYDEQFIEKFTHIYNFISKDSINRADIFKNDLKKHIELIPHFPYKARKSKWFEDEQIRDLIFKGYTIPYLIYDNKIIILDIFKWER